MRNLLSIFLAFSLLFFLGACGQSAGGDQAAEGEETEQMESEGMAEEAPADDQSGRKSPPREATGTIDGVDIAVNYGSPSVRGRDIWGALVPYGAVWRTGANEATTIEFSGDVTVEGQPLAAGKYGLFTIPGEDSWTIIFNKNPDQWGANDYDEAEDALRVTVTPEPTDESVEAMAFAVEDGRVILRWEKLAVPIAVKGAGG